MIPKLVIFDLDGTLVHFPREFLFLETARMMREFSLEVVGEDVLDFHFSEFDYFAFVPEDTRESFSRFFWKSFDWDNYPKPVLLPRVAELLEQLSRTGRQVAIATARAEPVAKLEAALDELGLLQHITMIAAREPERQDWMDKRVQIKSICDRLACPPEDSMMVGDVPPDITSARDAGVEATVAVLSGGIKRSVLEQVRPSLIVDSSAELLSLLTP